MSSTFKDMPINNFILAENFLDGRVARFMIELNRKFILREEVLGKFSYEELEKLFITWMQNGTIDA